MHDFKYKIFDDRYKRVLIELVKRLNKDESEIVAKEVMNKLDPDGFSPFLAYVREFISQHDELM